MAIGVIFDGVGMTQEQYYQVFNQVTNNGAEAAPGMLSHHAGPTDGGFCVIETWESQEALQTFFEDKLGEALAAANIQTQPRMFEIINSQ
jgi:hypothetical protein